MGVATPHLRHVVIILGCLAGFRGESLTAASAPSPTLADVSGHLDLSVPQSPAFTALGVTPQSVVQSDDLRTVSAGLLKGVDPRGNLQSGLAVDIRPYLLMNGSQTTLHDYRTSQWTKFLSRAQVSFATSSGTSQDDKADRQAIGLNLKLWLESDPADGTPRIKYKDANGTDATGTVDECYQSYLNAAAGAPPVLPDIPHGSAFETDAEKAIASNARKAISACLDPYKEQHWNSGSLELAVAGTHASVSEQHQSGSAIWLGYGHSLSSSGQVVFQVQRYDNRLLPVKTAGAAQKVVDETDAGVRIRAGSSHGTVMLEGMWTDSKAIGAHERYWRGSVGTEVMIFKDAWVQFAVGKAFGTTMFNNDTTYSGQLKFGFSDKSLLSGSK